VSVFVLSFQFLCLYVMVLFVGYLGSEDWISI